jgi:hypothetical protein
VNLSGEPDAGNPHVRFEEGRPGWMQLTHPGVYSTVKRQLLFQAARPVLITFTLRKRAGGQPCDTEFDCEGWPLPSLNVPPTK